MKAKACCLLGVTLVLGLADMVEAVVAGPLPVEQFDQGVF